VTGLHVFYNQIARTCPTVTFYSSKTKIAAANKIRARVSLEDNRVCPVKMICVIISIADTVVELWGSFQVAR